MIKRVLNSILLATSMALGSVAQDFHGTIVYDLEYLGDKADLLRSVMPTTYTIMVGKENIHYEVKGGISSGSIGRVLYIGETGQTWMIKDSEKTAYLITGTPPPVTPSVGVPEDEDLYIGGYSCKKYLVQTEGPGGFMVQDIWIAPDIMIPGGASFKILSENYLVQGVEGQMLKSMISENGTTIVITAREVDSLSLKKKKLKIPKDYRLDKVEINTLHFGI